MISFPVLPGPWLRFVDLLKHGGQQLTFIPPWGTNKLCPPCPPLSLWPQEENSVSPFPSLAHSPSLAHQAACAWLTAS